MSIRRFPTLRHALPAGAIFAGLCLGGWGSPGSSALAQEKPPAEEKKALFDDLPEASAKKLRDALDQWLKAITAPRQKLVTKRMGKEVEELAERFKLPEAAVTTLEESLPLAVEESRQPWEQATIDWIRSLYEEQLKESSDQVEQLINDLAESMSQIDEANIEEMLEEAPVSEKGHPRNQNAWKAALAKVLTPAQLAELKEDADLEKKEADKQLADLRDRILKASEGRLKAEIRPLVELLRNTIPLDAKRSEALDAAVAEAVKQALAASSKSITEALAKFPESTRKNLLTSEINEDFQLGGVNLEEAIPSHQSAWTDGLAKILSKDEQADWTKALAAHEVEEKKRFDEQFGRLIETHSENYRQSFTRQMDPKVADIQMAVDLDADRTAKLEAAAKKAVDDSIAAWKERALKEIAEESPNQREMMLQQGYISVGWRTEDQAENQKAWKDALESLLSADEQKRWEEATKRRADDRRRVAIRILVSLFDERLAFTADQRQKIEPFLAKAAAETLAKRLEQQWGSMNFQSIASMCRQADHAEIKKHLEDWQKKIWEARVEKPDPSEQGRRPPRQPGEGDEENKPTPAGGPDPVATERVISGFLYDQMVQERNRIEARLVAEVNAITRAANLPPPRQKRLLTAAKGAAEDEVNAWYNSYQQWVRNQIGTGNQNAATVEKLLAGIGRVSFGRQTKAEATGIWTFAISHLLTDAERAAWQQQTNVRRAYQREATLGLLIQQFDNAARLKPEQASQILQLASKSLETYGPDIERYFGNRDEDSPWELNSYYNVLILEGIPEKDFKALLTEKQWTAWESEFRGRVSGYWDSIKRYHDERMKKEAEEKKKQSAAAQPDKAKKAP